MTNTLWLQLIVTTCLESGQWKLPLQPYPISYPLSKICQVNLNSKRITAAAIDSTCTYIACGNHEGEAFILNLKSGGVLYQLPHTDQEVTCLKFLEGCMILMV